MDAEPPTDGDERRREPCRSQRSPFVCRDWERGVHLGVHGDGGRPWQEAPLPLIPTFGKLRNEPALCCTTPMIRCHGPPVLFRAPPPADVGSDGQTRRTSSGETRTTHVLRMGPVEKADNLSLIHI